MCLGQIGRVVAVARPAAATAAAHGAVADTAPGGALADLGALAVVRVDGVDRDVSLLTLGQAVAVGDWLVVHSGFALDVLDPDEAREALALRSTRPSAGT